eukprot:1822270-Prymnesium_polylepis.2
MRCRSSSRAHSMTSGFETDPHGRHAEVPLDEPHPRGEYCPVGCSGVKQAQSSVSETQVGPCLAATLEAGLKQYETVITARDDRRARNESAVEIDREREVVDEAGSQLHRVLAEPDVFVLKCHRDLVAPDECRRERSAVYRQPLVVRERVGHWKPILSVLTPVLSESTRNFPLKERAHAKR